MIAMLIGSSPSWLDSQSSAARVSSVSDQSSRRW
jgi:hypothetical protein